MIDASWLTALGTLGSVVVALSVAILTVTVRGTRRITRMESNIDAQQRTFDTHVTQSVKVHDELIATMREDRGATNGRLLFLERERMQR